MLDWSVAVLFMPVPGPQQTAQRADFWGAIIGLQSYWPCHLGIDNLNVARSIGLHAGSWLSLCFWSKMEIWLLLPST